MIRKRDPGVTWALFIWYFKITNETLLTAVLAQSVYW